MQLYDYQQQAIEGLRDGFRAGHMRQQLYGPTGCGKSIIALALVKAAVERGTKVAFLTERVALSEQFSRHLDSIDIDHGILQADHWRYRPHEKVQVCSQQTLESRGWPDVGLIIVDENHICRKRVTDWITSSNIPTVGLSATPFAKGMGLTYTNVVSRITTNQLIEQKRLVPMKVYAGVEADLRGAKKTAGEWQAADVTTRSVPIIGNITAEWVKHAWKYANENGCSPRQFKTFLFSPTVDYGEMLVEEFGKLGYRWAQISYRDANHERREKLLAELNDMNSDLCGIISVDALGRGTDVPNLRCVDMCRPFRKSFASHIQFLGRGLRTAPDKQFCTILDHSGNMVRFMDDMQYLFEHGCHDLDDGRLKDGVRKEKTAKEKKDILCSCGAVLMPYDKVCQACGKARMRKLSTVEQVPGELREIDLQARRNKETSPDDKKAWAAALNTYGKMHGYKPGWAAHKYKERFGHYPKGDAGFGAVFPEAMGWIKSREIAFRHARKRA